MSNVLHILVIDDYHENLVSGTTNLEQNGMRATAAENALHCGGPARVGWDADRGEPSITDDDDGPDIPATELDRVFDPFYRLKPSRSLETDGHWLGLSIAGPSPGRAAATSIFKTGRAAGSGPPWPFRSVPIRKTRKETDMKRIGTIFAGLPLVVAANAALADPGNWGSGYMGYGNMMGGYGIFGGGLMMIVFWGAVIALIVYGIRWMSDGQRPGLGRPTDALDALRNRFARGEIDEDEFKRRKATLEG